MGDRSHQFFTRAKANYFEDVSVDCVKLRNLLVCGISTQIHQQDLGFDNIISSSDPDFSTSGLQSQSLIRLGFQSGVPVFFL